MVQKILFCFLVLFVLSPAQGAESDPCGVASKMDTRKKAKRFATKKEFKKAVHELESILEKCSLDASIEDDAWVINDLGFYLAKAGDYPECVKLLQGFVDTKNHNLSMAHNLELCKSREKNRNP